MTTNVALIVIYNHKYDKNIEVVERIYRERFSVIYHLVPFYTGTKANVIPVYETSYCFQGYVAQGFKHFEGRYKHYFFVADDMVLNPSINEGNYATVFQLDDASGFLPELQSMPEDRWPHNRAAVTYDPYRPGVEIRNEIPPPAVAKTIIDGLKIRNGSYSIRNTYFGNGDFGIRNLIRQAIRIAYDKVVLKTNYRASKYPFVLSYSDIFIVSAVNAPAFVHYCGVFAATDLWVELAIPTALALTGEKIRVQSELTLQGRPLWTVDDHKLLDDFGYRLKDLLERFPKDYIYLHPIKLSKWNVEM